ncbi:hypothetical protein J7L01_02635, partial [bacterium]|nr:hypothetical protein [bacterium]
RFTASPSQKIRITYYNSMTVTVQTDFDGGHLTIDDSLVVTSPYSGPWHEDELHIINTDSVQTPGLGVKYLYRYWSDGGAKRHTIHISPDTLEYTAYFDTLYQLIIHAPSYSNPTPVDPDSVWFEPRSWATIDIEPDTVFLRTDSLERHIFRGWNGVGSGSYSGPDNSAAVHMNEPVNEYAIYDTAYWLGLDYAGCGTGVPAQIGEGWVFVHDSVEVMTAESLEDDGAWYNFTHWSGSVGDLRDSSAAHTWYVNPDLPRTIVANYEANPELAVFPNSMTIVAPGHYVLLPAILDAAIDYPVDSFRFTMHYDDSRLDYIGLINSSVIWSSLTATTGASSVTVFGDAPGSTMDITPPDTIFYFRMRAKLDASGIDTIDFDGFEYAFDGAETRPGYVNIVPLNISIDVTNDYGGDSVWIDGAAHPAPYSATWVGADIHEIGTDTLNPLSPGQRARFIGWSDGGARFHDVRPISDSSFTANFDTLLYLDVVSPFGTPSGSGWFDRGEEPAFSVAPEVIAAGLSRDIFLRWEGEGTSSYTGSDNPAACTIMTPITETAIWQHQFWLELEFSGCGAATPTLTGEGWHDAGAWTPISTDSIVYDGSTPYYFSWWSGGTVDDRFTHATTAFIDGIDTVVAIYSDVPFSFAFDVPETTVCEPSGVIEVPVRIDIPTSTELAEIGLNLYFDGAALGYAGVSSGDLAWADLDGTDLSAGADGHVYIHAVNPVGLPTDPSDRLCVIRLNVASGASGESAIIAADGGYDIAVASPDTGIVDVRGPISITVTTAPVLGAVSVDSSAFSAPFEAFLAFGSHHLIDVPSPQYPEIGVRMTFSDWSDGGAREHAVSPTSDTVFTADFDIDYRLQVLSEHGVTTG